MSDSDERLAAALRASEDCAAASDDTPERKQTDWWGEIKGIFWLVLAVLAFHSFVAKPFYIPSESMMPGLIQGDRLVVTKYPYGWSYVSPSFHVLPFIEGRLFGRMPERGDIVITVPRGGRSDYIKRVIGLPGDTIEVRGGAVFLNGTPLRREQREPAMIPIDANVPCSDFPALATTGSDGRRYCRMPVYREYTPEGRYYDTVDLGPSPADYYGPVTIPADHLFLMGDNRDQSADSRAPLVGGGLGGPVPVESIGGRAEFITFSLDGTSQWYNPISWFSAMRSGRAGTGLHPGRAGAE
ncbi:MAG: signal peptidase I [Parasphingopyxis sp.]|uniref:signal peptidase I n=1 Tax=Parasphingopyxis sp. TaxID=1920299 RepID=UPI003FA141CA